MKLLKEDCEADNSSVAVSCEADNSSVAVSNKLLVVICLYNC